MSAALQFTEEQRRTFGRALIIAGIILAFLRAWIAPATYNRSGYYVDWPVGVVLISLCIGLGVRLWLGQDRPSGRYALLSALATLLLGLFTEFILAANLARQVSLEAGMPAPPLVSSPREMLATLLIYWAEHSFSLLMWVLGVGAAAFINIMYSRDRLFAPPQSR